MAATNLLCRGGRRGGDKRRKMGADTLRADGGKPSGGRRRTWEEAVGDGSGWQGTAVDSGGRRRTVADNDGRRQFVGGAAVVWMMAVGSGVNNVWLIVSKHFFARRSCPYVALFFCPRFAHSSRQNKSLTKKSGQICPRAKKLFSLYVFNC